MSLVAVMSALRVNALPQLVLLIKSVLLECPGCSCTKQENIYTDNN